MTDTTEPKVTHRIPGFVPSSLRNLLYTWHPGRAMRWRLAPGVQRVAGGSLVLTFDDGPAKDATPRVLEELERAQAKATFFVLGREVEREPELAREIVRQGHEIALHGHEHLRHDKVTAAASEADLREGLRVISEVTGQRPVWFRPPFGRLSPRSSGLLGQLGLRVAYWSCAGIDWEEMDSDSIQRIIVRQMTPGAIVLLHDNFAYGRRKSAAASADAVTPIVAHGRASGATWQTLSAALSDSHTARI